MSGNYGKQENFRYEAQKERKFCICFRSANFGPSRPRPARRIFGVLHKNPEWILCILTKKSFVQNDEKRPPFWAASLQLDGIGFLNCYRDFVGLVFAIKSIVSDKPANFHILPSGSVAVLISQSVILGKGKPPVIDKFGIFRHGKFSGFLIIAGMFCGSPCKVIRCSNFQDITVFGVHIMPNIEKFFCGSNFWNTLAFFLLGRAG